MKARSVLVIGAGVGGIAAAAHLARQGMHVTVFEKNPRPGGRCERLVREGHTFDTGPTLFIMPHLYEAEFAALGAPMQERLDLQRVDPTYRLVFDDGSRLSLTSDMKYLEKQLEEIEPGSFRGFLRYMEEGKRHYELAMPRLVTRDFRKASEFMTPRNLPLLFQIKALVNHYRNMSSYFREPRLKSAFTFQDLYMGLSPFEAPAMFSMMPYTELAHGVWYPRGGMYSIVEALVSIAEEAGVEFVYGTTILGIDVDDTGARSVTLEDGSHLKVDAVLANADLPYVYKELLPDDGRAEQLEKKRFSCSVISFFWATMKRYNQLPPHLLFLAHDYRENFQSIIHDRDLPANPSIYFHAPTRLDPSMAPPGEDTLIAIIPVGHMSEDGDQDWGKIRDRARQAALKRLESIGICDLEQNIKFETSYTPPSWHRRYNLMKGATHGLCHNLTQLGYFRPPNRHPSYHNVYFVGASTHPGTGMPTALVSGRLAAQRMVDEADGWLVG
ncbi:MAG TPA: phytoene desaturase family protein [Anaerolineales bacterium]|nr:phytoene desaturase family protein [Anaerolineales bacterium]